MQTVVTDAGPYERLVTVQISETDLTSAKSAAASKLSQSMKIKGFRPGKAPVAIVEKMVGAEALRSEAIDEALPGALTEALREHEIVPATTPRLEEVRDIEGGVEAEVRVTLWPELDDLPDLSGRSVEVDIEPVGAEQIDGQVDRLRTQYAELEDVQRPGDSGDFVLINLSATRNGQPVEDATANDLLYEIGSASFLPGLDEVLGGASAGDIRETATTLPEGFGDHAGPADLKVLVKGVKARKLPEVDDEWVSSVTEFETEAELREAIEDDLGQLAVLGARRQFREQAMRQVVEDLEVELPEAIVEAEMEARVHNLAHQLEQQGIDMSNYLQLTGQDEQEFIDGLRVGAAHALKTRMLVDGVIRDEELEIGEGDLDDAMSVIARGANLEVDEVRRRMEESGEVVSLASDILRDRAIDVILDKVVAIDTDGNPVDLTLPDDNEDDGGTSSDVTAADESGSNPEGEEEE
ncbi:MAG: trigger factor [Acidimicrobiia bacterium]|nr:trigger factor [Acidimicrobiia bacterium]